MPAYQGYTQSAWKGEQYDKTSDLSLKEIAKRIKREALAKYGKKIKLSVKTEHFANGCSIDATVTAFNGESIYSDLYLEYRARGQRVFFDQRLSDNFKRLGVMPYDEEAKRRYCKKLDEIIRGVKAIGDKYNRSDCDAMIDYSDVHFYWNVGVDYKLEN